MNTLMPNLKDALSVHDAAHACQDTELHNVALKLLALTGQVHIVTDSLDYEAVIHGWGDLPGAICVSDESAALYGGSVLLVEGEIDESVIPSGVQVKQDQFLRHRSRVPAYSTWMVRMQEAVPEKPEETYKFGEYVVVGSPRLHGAYRFPVYCLPVSADYQMLQVHKQGDSVLIFGKDGKLVRGMAKEVDLFVNADQPQQGIFEIVISGGVVKFWDVLMLDGMNCTSLPYSERERLMADLAANDDVWHGIELNTDSVLIDSQDTLHTLKAGEWLVRYRDEILSDSMIRPFWFVRDSGSVTIGTVLPWVLPKGEARDASGMVRVMDTGLPPLQIHKKGKNVNVYVAEGGRNRDTNLPQVVEMARCLPEDFIIEAQWTCLDNGVPVSAGRVQNPKSDLSECEVKLYPYDVLVYGDMNLTDQPMYERVEVLERIVGDFGNDSLQLGLSDDGGIAFDPDSVRPLDGDCSHCFRVAQ